MKWFVPLAETKLCLGEINYTRTYWWSDIASLSITTTTPNNNKNNDNQPTNKPTIQPSTNNKDNPKPAATNIQQQPKTKQQQQPTTTIDNYNNNYHCYNYNNNHNYNNDTLFLLMGSNVWASWIKSAICWYGIFSFRITCQCSMLLSRERNWTKLSTSWTMKH